GGLTATQAVSIAINDVNEAPLITSGTTANIHENGLTSIVLYTATSTDEDAGSVRSYQIIGSDAALLQIDANTGAITLRQSADYENKSFYQFQVIASDETGMTATQSVTVTVLNVNETPQINVGVASATLFEAGGIANEIVGTTFASATVSKSDVDSTVLYDFSWLNNQGWIALSPTLYSKQGQFGTAVLDSTTDQLRYQLEDDNPHTQALSAGEQQTDRFTIQVSDGVLTSGADAEFIVIGSNDAAHLGQDLAVLQESDQLLTASGQLSISDVDNPALFQVQSGTAGLYGQFVIDAGGQWWYQTTAPQDQFTAGQWYSESFAVSSADGTQSQVEIRMQGSNDAPTLTADSQTVSVEEAGGVNDQAPGEPNAIIVLHKGDVDGAALFDTSWLQNQGWVSNALGSVFEKAGQYGKATLYLSTGEVSYQLDNSLLVTEQLQGNEAVTDAFSVQVSDGTAVGGGYSHFPDYRCQ
ncbi:MAG: cadherin domain-containing protein, partial [Magnetococcales bacterium]|nr:cadherin domain-containing protein [Magnetococcales bacterium]